MKKADNYALQAQQARNHFLSYDQNALQKKLGLRSDDSYLYAEMLCKQYRVHRTTGDVQRQAVDSGWEDANTFAEVMTLLDLVCDSRENRFLSGRWKNMQAFGLQFHRNLLEEQRDPDAEFFAEDPARFAAACEALGGTPIPQGDVGYSIPFFDGLNIGIQLWLGDDEFPSAMKYMWDENALQYLRYETMYYAKGLLLRRLREEMEQKH